MDRDEKLYMDNMSKLSLNQIRKLFDNLKNIGMTDQEIDKYAEDYHKFFQAQIEHEKKYAKSQTIFISDSKEHNPDA